MSDVLRAGDRALERLSRLHPKKIDLSLDRMRRLLAALGHPERRLAPVIHVAGTNGKGSTVAFLRAFAEAQGLRTHVFTSPHLVRFAERIRLAGRLIEDDALAALLDRVEAANAGEPITFFEITGAAALAAFVEAPADLCIVEVGLGGRYDATNVVETTAVSVIAPVDMDHREFLGDSLGGIATEKAGILRPDVPAVVAHQKGEALDAIEAEAERVGAPLLVAGRDWDAWSEAGRLVVQMGDRLLDLPLPNLPGAHQVANAGLAAAAALTLHRPSIGEAAIAEGLQNAIWPARLQRLTAGPLGERAQGAGADLWLDGAHNPHAAAALADFARGLAARDGRPVVAIMGLLANKDAAGVFAALNGTVDRVLTVGFDAPTAAAPEDLARAARAAGLSAETCADVPTALEAALAGPPPHVIIAGSLYLAGEVLAMSPQTWPR